MAKAGKKSEVVSLQIEVETELQWKNLIRREGLIIVDVYAGWAGPCVSMINILKRLKAEINDDRLWLAVACSDEISDLLMFKDQSEPTWLFLGGGKPVKIIRGCHAPKFILAVKSEFEYELACMEGKSRRNLVSIDDEVSRRKKTEAEAVRLAKMIKEEDDTANELNEIRRESSVRLMNAMESYTILIIQNFLLQTDAVKEIRDFLMGDFNIEQERYVSMFEEGVRELFRIPYEIHDPSEPLMDFGYNEEARSESEVISQDPDADNEDDRDEAEVIKPKKNTKPRRKMIPVDLPDGLIGDTLVMLLESVDIKKGLESGKTPRPGSLLQTADDYIQLKVGPVSYQDALEHAPYSLHAIYGRGLYAPGVWCPRRYDDKRFVMINFFARFVTEVLMPQPRSEPRYMVAVYPVSMAKDIMNHEAVVSQKHDVLAEGKLKIPAALADEMLKSWSSEGEDFLSRKKALTQQVFVVSVDKRNSSLRLALQSMKPIHISYDNGYGRVESSKLFQSLNIKLDDMPDPDTVVEKFLARSRPRIESVTEIDESDIPAPMTGDDENEDNEFSDMPVEVVKPVLPAPATAAADSVKQSVSDASHEAKKSSDTAAAPVADGGKSEEEENDISQTEEETEIQDYEGDNENDEDD